MQVVRELNEVGEGCSSGQERMCESLERHHTSTVRLGESVQGGAGGQ